MKNITRNWKTTLIGIAVLVSIVLYALREITTEQLVMVIGTASGVGFFASKDGDKTGVK